MRLNPKAWSCTLLLIGLLPIIVLAQGNNEVVEEEPHGPIDFSEAEVQEDGSLCVIKTKMVPKMKKLQVKECWHQNITQCHETYVTEFRPAQERECEENFWKACKITFREQPYNYTLKTCMTPLVKKCDEEPQQGYGTYGQQARQRQPPQMVCKTWFESTCNTTYTESPNGGKPKPQTWCKKEPRKICAPDNCRMEPGEEICHDKTLESTVRKPEEVCDLQPQTQCRLVTNLVPHLENQVVCREIPKEVCHLKLDHPKMVQEPVKLKWCTKAKAQEAPKPTYNPPPPPQYQAQASTNSYSQQPELYQFDPREYQPIPTGYQNSVPESDLPPVLTSYPSPAPPQGAPTPSPIYYRPQVSPGPNRPVKRLRRQPPMNYVRKNKPF